VWIDVVDLAPGTATPFYLYWGNDKATDGSDPKATYDPDQLLVYHFNEENGLPKDTTGFTSNALTAGARDEAGLIGDALRLDRDKPPLRIAKSPSLAIPDAQPMTFTMWLNVDPSALTAILFSVREGQNGFTIGLDNGVPYAQIDSAGGARRSTGGGALRAGEWHHLAVIAADKVSLYLDGQAGGSLTGSLPAINGQPMLGASEVAGTPRYVGLVDEFGIAKTARPVGAIAVAVASQGPNGKLVSFDQPEASTSDAPGFLVIILRSVTIDAWMVIGILAVLALVSWYVMYAKTAYLNRLGKANRVFQLEYRQLLKAADGDHMVALHQIVANDTRAKRHAGLQRLAKICVTEMAERLRAGRLQPGGSFSPQTLGAIQSALETGMAHEQHALGNLMVALVISISGGPFIGLLGTVVGVMITFASIAAAGDVNVNAIAPGIAAALLATAAGMFVAIPAMFGYNYLLIRIKGVVGDMGHFCNETMARMGEARELGRHAPASALAPQAVAAEMAPIAALEGGALEAGPREVGAPEAVARDAAAARAAALARRAERLAKAAAATNAVPARGNK
jgi:biopolymer transport protein ExbB